jgi:hypothetical protein
LEVTASCTGCLYSRGPSRPFDTRLTGPQIPSPLSAGWLAGARLPVRARNYLLHSVRTNPGGHQAPYSLGTGGCSFTGLKRLWHDANHLLSSGAEVRSCGAIPLVPIRLKHNRPL